MCTFLALLLNLNPGSGREWMYEMGRAGYEYVLKSATQLEPNTSVLEPEILWLCTNEFSCALNTLYALEELNPAAESSMEELKCDVYQKFLINWNCAH